MCDGLQHGLPAGTALMVFTHARGEDSLAFKQYTNVLLTSIGWCAGMRSLPQVDKFLRTPDTCFQGLTDFPYQPHYTEVGGLRVAFIDEGPRDGPLVYLLHGEPAWSYLYRKMIPVLVQAGCRVIAPDQVGFGRSDKPTRREDYTYANHVAWMSALIEQQGWQDMTFFGQDWGSLIGLRVVAGMPERFARIALGNAALPTGQETLPPVFRIWRAFAMYSPWFPIGRIVKTGCQKGLTDHEVAAYNAPFPGRAYRVGARVFPTLVPDGPNHPEGQVNARAWDEVFKQWHKPLVTLFSNRDPITKGGYKIWQDCVPGAQGQPHANIRGAGHFLQEDSGVEVAQALVQFIHNNPLPSP